MPSSMIGNFLPASVIAALLFSGCGVAKIHVLQPLESGKSFPKTVAILPFTIDENIVEDQNPHHILREVFSNYFFYLGYTDMPLKEVDAKLHEGNVSISQSGELDFRRLATVLGTDAVIRGHVKNATNFTGVLHAETSIKARLEMIDLGNGNLLWEVEHNEITYSGIASPSVVDIIRDQIENSKVKHAYYGISESFSQQVAKIIPDPAGMRENDIHLPRIASIDTNLKADKKLQTRDRIYVSLRGQPGMTATFDIGSWRTSIPMKEVAPGHYTGSYQIKEGDRITNALIIGALKNKEGLSSKKYYKAAMATIINN